MRHTNFAIESIDQVFQGQAGYGQRVTCTLGRNGDLVTNLVLEVTLRKGSNGAFYPAEHLLKEVVLEIGGQKVDTVTNTWLRLYDELYRKVDAREAYSQMTDFADDDPVGTVKRFYVVIPFWFSNGDLPNALPLISLQYHEVTLHFKFEDAANIPGIDPTFEPEIILWADYVFLDNDERRWFAQAPHEYLIEQTQTCKQPVGVDTAPKTSYVPLTFNHPVKYLAWVLKPGDTTHGIFTSNQVGLESREAAGPVDACGLQLNGTDRFKPRKGSYFRLQHPVLVFGQAPSVGVYVYSFAIAPARPVPSGSMNFSRIDQARLILTTKAAVLASLNDPAKENETLATATNLQQLEIYARNHNILRIASGMAGMVYSN